MDCDIGEDELFALAARSHSIGDGQWDVRPSDAEDSDGGDDDNGDDWSGSTVVQLCDGSWHVCRGMDCPHLGQSTNTDRLFTCKLSGRVVACEQPVRICTLTGCSHANCPGGSWRAHTKLHTTRHGLGEAAARRIPICNRRPWAVRRGVSSAARLPHPPRPTAWRAPCLQKEDRSMTTTSTPRSRT